MVINEINICAFGNIKSKKIEFTDGFNVLLGENEKGKSTFLSFIRFVLYGFNGRKSILKKYEPSSGEKINGSIVVTQEGMTYEITINLNLTKAKQVSVINKTTGEVMDKDFCQSVGEKILKQNDDSFINTLFIGQTSIANFGDKQELLKKLSNISQSGDEDISFSEILSKTDDEILNLTSPRRKDTVLPKLENEINELNSLLFSLKKEAEEKEEKLEMLEDVKKELKLKEKEKKEYEKQLEISKILTLKKREKDESNNIIRLKTQIENTKKEIEEITLDERFSDIDSEAESEFLREVTYDFDKDKMTKSQKLFFILSLICGILCVPILVFSFMFMWQISFSAIVFASLAVVFILKSNDIKKQINEYITKKTEAETKKQDYLNKYGATDKSDYLAKKTKYETDSKKIAVFNEKLRLQEENYEFSVKMHNEAKDDILTNYKNIDTIKIADYEKYKDVGRISASIQSAEENIKRLTETKHRLEFETEKTQKVDIVSVMEKLDAKKEELKSAHKKLNVLETFKKYLILSFDELKSNFAPQLAFETSRIFSYLTNNKHSDVIVNDSFDASVKMGTSYLGNDYLSTATLEQLYLSVRLGIIKVIGDENYPVILDDAFAFYDDVRLKNVLEFFKDYSKKNQVIVSSCHTREADYLKDDANIIKL